MLAKSFNRQDMGGPVEGFQLAAAEPAQVGDLWGEGAEAGYHSGQIGAVDSGPGLG